MILSIKNIGKIASADIEINGITVIGGENNTGKSTVGKALYCAFNNCYNLQKRIQATKEGLIDTAINDYLSKQYFDCTINSKEVVKKIFENINLKESEVKDILIDSLSVSHLFLSDDSEEIETTSISSSEKEKAAEGLASVIQEILNKYSGTDGNLKIYQRLLSRKLSNIFAGQICNLNSPEEYGKITLTIKNKDIEAEIKNNIVIHTNSEMISLNTEAIYIDDISSLDDTYPSRRGPFNYKNDLFWKLRIPKEKSEIEEAVTDIIVNDKINNILEKINKVCDGQIVSGNRKDVVYRTAEGFDLSPQNISTGLKAFIVIKTLFLNGFIEKNGTIILDEPEIHLHPDWQIAYAEIIVLLHKEFDLNVLLSTHSPYFLEAIQVYAEKYEVSNKCKYYLSSCEGKNSVFTDTSDEVEQIYKKLAKPFQTLENEKKYDD